MGQALYRKYRSKSLDEIVGQEHITTTLKNALGNGGVSHAYLFTGPRGTGKTSIARILAHEVNKLPYSDTSHLDIIEIDAASNRRIDEIRELRERVHIAPSSAKYKVYIIDEVHMLTKEAFNALLKTLEEPPEHVIFILATTEAHKLPETIVSRTQRFTFKPVPEQAVVDHLRFIASEEGVHVTDDALKLIAAHGGGSFRDSISLLDQVRGHSDSVTVEDVQTMLGIAPEDAVATILDALEDGDVQGLMQHLQTLRQHGYQSAQIARQLSAQLRESILTKHSPLEAKQTTTLLQELLAVSASHDPNTALELALIDVALQNTPRKIVSSPVEEAIPTPDEKPQAEPKKQVSTQEPARNGNVPNIPLDETAWNTVLDTLKSRHNTLYSVSRMAIPHLDGNTVTLSFRFAFHQKRINEVKNKQIIADLLQEVTGVPVSIICVVANDTADSPVKTKPTQVTDTTIATISNIFGGAEVLD